MKRLTNFHCVLLLTGLAVAGALSSCQKSAVSTVNRTNNLSTSTNAALIASVGAIQVSTATTGSFTSVTGADIGISHINISGIFIIGAYPHGATKDSVTFASLPAAIGTYLTANYSGYTFVKAFKISVSGTVNSYAVVINYNGKPVGLKFDASGNFVLVFEQREGHDLVGDGWHDGGLFCQRGGHITDTVAISALPTAIKSYFTTNYPKDTLLHAGVNFAGDYIVLSQNAGLFATSLSATGTLIARVQLYPHVRSHVSVAQSALPASVSTYLSTTYPAYVFDKAFAEKLNDVLQGYFVFINANNTHVAVQFDATGTFVKAFVLR